MAAVEQLGRPIRDKAEAVEWLRSKGVFSYAIGAKDAPGTWRGHLVAVVRQRVLVDLTIGQANHRECDMVLTPFGDVSGRFLNGHGQAIMDNNACRVIYEALPGDRSYEATPNWRYKDCAEWRAKSNEEFARKSPNRAPERISVRCADPALQFTPANTSA